MTTVSIPLNQGKFALIDEADADLILGRQWFVQRVAQSDSLFYAYTGSAKDGTRISMHRLITGAEPGVLVDHRNGDGLDNRRHNLRTCTHTQNMQNRKMHSNNRSGFKGVYQHRGKGSNRWYAQLRVDGRRIHIGAFPTPEDAARAYDEAALRHHGEFARLNFPEEAAA